MPDTALLFYHVTFQPFWQQHGLIQACPRPTGGSGIIDQFRDPGVQGLQASLAHAGCATGVAHGYWCAVTCTMASVRSMRWRPTWRQSRMTLCC